MSAACEEWRAAPGYEGRYEVSDLGRIRSLPRVELTKRGHSRTVHGGLLKPALNAQGYLHVSLRINGKLRLVRLHRLIALAFKGDKRNALHNEVAHLDNDRANARADNLKWVSKVENRSHRKLHGTECGGENHAASKLTNSQAEAIRTMRGLVRHRDLASEYGVSVWTIQDVIYGRTYRQRPPTNASGGLL